MRSLITRKIVTSRSTVRTIIEKTDGDFLIFEFFDESSDGILRVDYRDGRRTPLSIAGQGRIKIPNTGDIVGVEFLPNTDSDVRVEIND